MRSATTPNWATRIASAWTLSRECRVEESRRYQPGQFEAIAAPTLLLTGSQTPADVSDATRHAADAIGVAEVRLLAGHGHFAHKADPAMVAAIIREFIVS